MISFRRTSCFNLARTILSLVALLVFSAQFRPVAAQSIKAVRILFETTDEDKDLDSRIQVSLKDRKGQEFATLPDGTRTDAFVDRSTHAFVLTVTRALKKADVIGGGQLIIKLLPAGKDTWRFNCSITLDWSV